MYQGYGYIGKQKGGELFPFMTQSGKCILGYPMPLLLDWNDPDVLTGESLPSLKKP